MGKIVKKNDRKKSVSKIKMENKLATKRRVCFQRHKPKTLEEILRNKVKSKKKSEKKKQKKLKWKEKVDEAKSENVLLFRNLQRRMPVKPKEEDGSDAADDHHDSSERKHEIDDESEEEVCGVDALRSFDMGCPEKKVRALLPIKTSRGLIQQSMELNDSDLKQHSLIKSEDEIKEEISSDTEVKPDEESLSSEDVKYNNVIKAESQVTSAPPIQSTAQIYGKCLEMLQAVKTQIGCLATAIVENPSGRLKNLEHLLELMKQTEKGIEVTATKYACLSLLEVFHNLIPSYRLRDEDTKQPMKKETKETYHMEKQLLGYYKKYLQTLEEFLENYNEHANYANEQIGLTSLKCMADLFVRHPMFNFSQNISHLIVSYVNHRNEAFRGVAAECLKSAFRQDRNGKLSVQLVHQINKLVRKTRFQVFPDALDVFSALQVRKMKNEDDSKLAATLEKHSWTHKEKLVQKLLQKKQPKLSANERKRKKKIAILEASIAGEKNAEKLHIFEQHQTEILKRVFGLYIHVLKKRPNDKLLKVVFAGLAQFAHLINVEYFVDLMDLLYGFLVGTYSDSKKDDVHLSFRERLHCIQTVFTILTGQGDQLIIDPHRFYVQFYSDLLQLCSVENHSCIEVSADCCQKILLEGKKRINIPRVLSFGKRMGTVALSLEHHGALAFLAIIKAMFRDHMCMNELLDHDMEGASGIFSPDIDDPLYAHADATALWELHLLGHHYHPVVKQLSRHIVAGAPIQGRGSLPPHLATKSAEDLLADFASASMKFQPPIFHPTKLFGSQEPKDVAFKKMKNGFSHHPWVCDPVRREVEELLLEIGAADNAKVVAIECRGPATKEKLTVTGELDFFGACQKTSVDIPQSVIDKYKYDCSDALAKVKEK